MSTTLTLRQQFWQQHISSWQASGLSQKTYCTEHNLKPNTFSHWHCKFKTPSAAASEPQHGKLLRLGSTSTRIHPNPRPSTVTLDTPQGFRLHGLADDIAQLLPVVSRVMAEHSGGQP